MKCIKKVRFLGGKSSKESFDIACENIVKLILSHFFHFPKKGGTGIIHQYIHRIEFFDGVIEQCCDVVK